MSVFKYSSDGKLREIIIDRLDSGRSMPRVVVSLTRDWAGFGINRVRDIPTIGPHDLSPTEFGYHTILWFGRVMVNLRKK